MQRGPFSRGRLLLVCAALTIGGCGEVLGPAGPDDASLPGVYTGTFPCRNCPGIRVSLWLKPDGRFFISQKYLEDVDADVVTTYNLGRWRPIAKSRGIELRGDGPRRFFSRADRDTLVMRTDSEGEYRLMRKTTAPEFTPIIRVAGMMSTSGDGTAFAECLTGFVAPVDPGHELLRFQQQYRSIGAPGEPVYVEFEGRFLWSKSGSLSSFGIERFISIRENRAC